ncbi:endonuclease/exonuclease/phosphatase family protein [Pendulispora brunnea]|uniref:Endonuclease/exonuclease/phosphatase family protein n=1 Tax=Pendulispora brunnea TaxID=2905690 RepID=A0ABZ2K605_9BACT
MRVSKTFATALLCSAVGCTAATSPSESEGTSASPVAASGTFNVVTYNVDGLPAILQGNGGDPEKYTPTIGQKLRQYDLVNVQEDFNSHAALYANDNHPYRTATSGGAGIGSGLNTMSVFPFADDIDRVKWQTNSSTDGNNLTPKGFTWLRLRLAEGVYIDTYNVHTNAGDSDAALSARRANILQLVDYIGSHSAGNAVLVFGDTNTRYTRTGDNIRNLLGAVGHDSWVDLMKGGTPPAQGSPALVWDDENTVLTDFGYEFVDKVLYRSNAYISLSAQTYSVLDGAFRDSDGHMLSDHRPVFTKFQYTLASGLRLSDQFGGPHGDSYNDANQLPARPTVQSISLRSANRVDQVSLTLGNGTRSSHGGTGGTEQSLALNAGEHVTSVQLYADDFDGHTRIFHASFGTSQGRTLAGGTKSGSSVTYTAPEGWQIVGFHGRSGDEVDKLGVIFAPVP